MQINFVKAEDPNHLIMATHSSAPDRERVPPRIGERVQLCGLLYRVADVTWIYGEYDYVQVKLAVLAGAMV